jgi:hypothetical protein
MRSGLITTISLVGLFIGTALVILLAFEGGLRFGRWRAKQPDPEPQLPARMIISSVLSLLAFILGFTFALSASHFDSRAQSLNDEVIALATAYRRAGLLPDPECAKIRDLLREYVDLRLQAPRSADINNVIARLRRLQEQIWSHAISAETKHTGLPPPTLLLQSLNEALDLNAERLLTNMQARIPFRIWCLFYGIAIVSIAAAGYHSGLAGNRRRSYAAFAYALVFAAVIVMIADADIPQFGHFEVSYQPLMDLRTRLSP